MPKNRKLTRNQVVDRIMSVIKHLPEAVKELPEDFKTRSYWEGVFKNGEPAERIMEVLRELPAFTYMVPKNPSRKSWIKVFEKHMGLRQVPEMLRKISAYARFTPVKRKRIKYWRDAFGKGEAIQRVRPVESDEYIHNPHRGTTTFQRFQGEAVYPSFITGDTFGPVTFPSKGKIKDNIGFIPRTTLTYCRWPWAWLEPEKRKYRWDIIDNTLKAAREAGQTVQLRFQPYTENWGVISKTSRVNLPAWYWETGAARIEKSRFTAIEPDHNDPLYLKHFGEFIKAFGKRYDGHPDIESVDVAYGGYWGEGGGNCLPRTANKLVDIYLKSFKKTQLILLIGTLQDISKTTVKAKKALGFRADCIGDLSLGNSPDVPSHLSWNHTFDCYPKCIEEGGVKEAWKTAPVVMESCGNVATWVANGYDFDTIIREGYKYHTSVFMPKNVFYPEKVREKLIEFDKKIGYRYAVRQVLMPIEVKNGTGFNIETFIDNVGAAPIYRPYKLALRFTQGKKIKIVKFKKDIRTWLPGHNWFKENLIFSKGFKKGEVKVALGIIDDKNLPKVWFAIKGKTDKDWHPLTSMDVV
ncbi:MAG: hypothetical protein A2231_06650 [Candidatus Firestonebacteria bacterium RIFOXYA2_FULL_40_8]|nr:MAG: hypothetical protein A2231_06650 [Candidatus Firestonebacteria bacterium RIFOXYA2_FULL_40_8]